MKALAPFASILKTFSSGAVYEFATDLHCLSSVTSLQLLLNWPINVVIIVRDGFRYCGALGHLSFWGPTQV